MRVKQSTFTFRKCEGRATPQPIGAQIESTQRSIHRESFGQRHATQITNSVLRTAVCGHSER